MIIFFFISETNFPIEFFKLLIHKSESNLPFDIHNYFKIKVCYNLVNKFYLFIFIILLSILLIKKVFLDLDRTIVSNEIGVFKGDISIDLGSGNVFVYFSFIKSFHLFFFKKASIETI